MYVLSFCGLSVTSANLSLNPGTFSKFNSGDFLGPGYSSPLRIYIETPTHTHSLTPLKLWIWRQQMTVGEQIHRSQSASPRGKAHFMLASACQAHCEAQLKDCLGHTSAVGLRIPCVVNRGTFSAWRYTLWFLCCPL